MTGSFQSPFPSAIHPSPLADYPAQFKNIFFSYLLGRRPGIKCVVMEPSMTVSRFYSVSQVSRYLP